MGRISICVTKQLENGKRSTQYNKNQPSNKLTPVMGSPNPRGLSLLQFRNEGWGQWKNRLKLSSSPSLSPVNSRFHTKLWFLAVNMALHSSVSYQTILRPLWHKFLAPHKSSWVTWMYIHSSLLSTQKVPSSLSSLGYKLRRFDPSKYICVSSLWHESLQEMVLTQEVADNGLEASYFLQDFYMNPLDVWRHPAIKCLRVGV